MNNTHKQITLLRNDLLQVLYEYGVSPVYILLWSSKRLPRENPLLHTSHINIVTCYFVKRVFVSS